MKKYLLVCIAHHYSLDRLAYLMYNVLHIISDYGNDVKIIIDTNSDYLLNTYFSTHSNVEVFVHNDLLHPFHLTWWHRQHIKDNIDNYYNFMYVEDDIYLPFANYISYLEKFKMLWPTYVPSFIRVEKKDSIEYMSDVPEKHKIKESDIINIEGRKFISFRFPHNYHGFWIMPAQELKETIKNDFVKFTDGREFAASYTAWELGKKPLVEIYEKDGKYFISPSCYSYHLPNNYALSKDSPNGKIKVEDIFI